MIDRCSNPLDALCVGGGREVVGLCQDRGRNWELCGCDQEDDCSIMDVQVGFFGFSQEKEPPPSFPMLAFCVKKGDSAFACLFDRGRISPQALSVSACYIDLCRIEREESGPVTGPGLLCCTKERRKQGMKGTRKALQKPVTKVAAFC